MISADCLQVLGQKECDRPERVGGQGEGLIQSDTDLIQS